MNWIAQNAGVLLNSVAIGLLLFMVAVGLTIIFGLLDVLNLAHGAFFLTGAYIGYRIGGEATATWTSFGLAMLVAIVLGAVLGVLFMVAITPLIERGHVDQALLSLGIALVISELLLLMFGKEDHSVAAPGGLAGSTTVFGSTYPIYRLAIIGVGAVIAFAVWWTLERTSAGATIRATVSDRWMVEAVGIDVRVVMVVTFAAASALAVLGGVLGGPVLGATSALGNNMLVLAMIVIVIGGLGSVLGTLIGALVVGLIQNIGPLIFPEYASFILFLAMILVLAFRPQGLVPSIAVESR